MPFTAVEHPRVPTAELDTGEKDAASRRGTALREITPQAR